MFSVELSLLDTYSAELVELMKNKEELDPLFDHREQEKMLFKNYPGSRILFQFKVNPSIQAIRQEDSILCMNIRTLTRRRYLVGSLNEFEKKELRDLQTKRMLVRSLTDSYLKGEVLKQNMGHIYEQKDLCGLILSNWMMTYLIRGFSKGVLKDG